MASSLRAKLAQVSGTGTAHKADKPQMQPMTYVEHATVADERLHDLCPDALARLGFEGEWPGIGRALFLDTETTGLSRGAGTIAFMIGLGYVRDGAFIIEQYMVGDYPDEPEMIAKLANLAKDFDVIVSFNGKAFDVPLLESRAVMCRMQQLFPNHRHLDLMHPSRRLWKRRIGSCRLTALEEHILCSGREDDLPGSEAPKRFFEYMKTGDISLLDEVLKHNMLDIASLGTLLVALCGAYASPDQLPELPDLYSMGRALERQGELDVARRCYEEAAKPRTATSLKNLRDEQFSAEACMSLSMMKKKAGDLGGAEAIWQQMARRGQMGDAPHVELAKLYEHGRKNPRLALESAQRAMETAQTGDAIREHERRIARLRAKLQREER